MMYPENSPVEVPELSSVGLDPNEKRKKTSDSGDGNSHNGCHCRKSKCLRRNCSCFASGTYCSRLCACRQGCRNRPIYKDSVLEPPANNCGEDGTHLTPSSERDRRACACKNCRCLNNYCICYSVKVGCSDWCRCQGCENEYDQKEENGVSKNVVSSEDTIERRSSSFVEEPETMASCNLQNMTPLSPSFQCSNNVKDASEAWFPSAINPPSLESGLTFKVDMPPVDEFSPMYHGPFPNPQECAHNSEDQLILGNRHFSSQSSSQSSLHWRSSPKTPMPAWFSGDVVRQALPLDDDRM